MATMMDTSRTQEIEITPEILDAVYAELRNRPDAESLARVEWISRLARLADADDVARLRAEDTKRTQTMRAIDC